MRILESERLLIKPVEEEDIYELLEFRWQRDTMAYSIHEPISRQAQLAWYRSLSPKDLALSIFLKEQDEPRLVGTVGLYDIDTRHQRAVFRFRLTSTAWGEGVGFEAGRMVMEYGFRTLNLQRIYCDQFVDNSASVHTLQRLGAVEEGVLRRHYYHDGEFKDVLVVGVLKEEFFPAVEAYEKELASRKKAMRTCGGA
jgi:RimJ/RimL family protein N-acetyltransferase